MDVRATKIDKPINDYLNLDFLLTQKSNYLPTKESVKFVKVKMFVVELTPLELRRFILRE